MKKGSRHSFKVVILGWKWGMGFGEIRRKNLLVCGGRDGVGYGCAWGIGGVSV